MKPYVYKVTHKQTGEYYIGMRSANSVPAKEDLGVYYFTSSKKVKEDFSNYRAIILDEFENATDAFIYENKLIEDNWGDTLLLNKHFQKTPSSFSMAGFKRLDVSENNRITKSKPKEIRNYKCSECGEDVFKEEFVHRKPKEHYYCDASCRNKFTSKKIRESSKDGNYHSKETREKISKKLKNKEAWNKGKSISEEQKKNISNSLKGRDAWNKGIKSPQSAGNGKKGALKQSIAAKGRKMSTREDGSRYWTYPQK